jgi:hypothetical protein
VSKPILITTMSTALASRMERIETKLEHFESSMDKLVNKNEGMDQRVVSIDRKLDLLIYDLRSYNDRLVKVEKTVNDDIIPWKHFVHKAVIILGTLASVLGIVRFML